MYNWREYVKSNRVNHTTYASIAIRIDAELKRFCRTLEIGGEFAYGELSNDLFLVSKERYASLAEASEANAKPPMAQGPHVQTGTLTSAPPVIGAVVLALSGFMVSRIPFRSFKDLKLNPRTGVAIVIALGATGFVAWRFHPALALVVLLASYVTIGLAESIVQISRRIREPSSTEPDSNNL